MDDGGLEAGFILFGTASGVLGGSSSGIAYVESIWSMNYLLHMIRQIDDIINTSQDSMAALPFRPLSYT